VPIGAVVTDANGRILSRGRNRINERDVESEYLHGQTLAHAEINALIALGVHGDKRHELALYTTVEPCPLCLGAF
jgi:tRNA(Arg) A34 adenosine deaminase TadA